MSASEPWWGVVAVYLVPAGAAMLGAALAGRIRGRVMAFLGGFLAAFMVFAGLWVTLGVLLIDQRDGREMVDWRVAVFLVASISAPVGLLGGIVALAETALRHPAKPSAN